MKVFIFCLTFSFSAFVSTLETDVTHFVLYYCLDSYLHGLVTREEWNEMLLNCRTNCDDLYDLGLNLNFCTHGISGCTGDKFTWFIIVVSLPEIRLCKTHKNSASNFWHQVKTYNCLTSPKGLLVFFINSTPQFC